MIVSPDLTWQNPFTPPPWNELVIYEMHLGTFPYQPESAANLFAAVAKDFGYPRDLGINAIHLLPECPQRAGPIRVMKSCSIPCRGRSQTEVPSAEQERLGAAFETMPNCPINLFPGGRRVGLRDSAISRVQDKKDADF